MSDKIDKSPPSTKMRTDVANEMIRAVTEILLLAGDKVQNIRVEVEYWSGEEQAFRKDLFEKRYNMEDE